MRPADVPRRALALALAAALASPRPGRADDPPGKVEMGAVDIQSLLDLSVEAVTRRPERSSKAPAAVFVVTGEDVRRHGYRTLAEILGSVPGLFAYPGAMPQVGVRGMGILGDFTTRLLVLVDGHSLMNGVGIDLGRGLPVPLSAIERVEVIKGPVGSVYGPSAFFGVVNLVTAGAPAGAEVWIGGEAAQGRLTAGEASATWQTRGEDRELLLAAAGTTRRGLDYDFPGVAGVDGRLRRMDFADAGQGYARLRWGGVAASASWPRGCGSATGSRPTGAWAPSGRTRRTAPTSPP